MKWISFALAFIVTVAVIYQGLLALDAFTPEAFSVLTGSALAFVFGLFPKLRDQWDTLEGEEKQYLMLGMMILAVYGGFALSCFRVIAAPWVCSVSGGTDALLVLIVSWAAANQGTYMGIKKISARAKGQ